MKEGRVKPASLLALVLMGILVLTLNIGLVNANMTIYIRPDGKIDPPNAPIQRNGSVYTFLDDINGSIVVERDSIVVDGAGYTLRGSLGYESRGVDLTRRINVTVVNIAIEAFWSGIYLHEASTCNIIESSLRANIDFGISVSNSSTIAVLSNNITGNGLCGIRILKGSGDQILDNEIADNSDGIGIRESLNETISGNLIRDGRWNGICVRSSSLNSVYGNTIVDNKAGLVVSWSSKNNTVFQNDIGENEYGIYIAESSNNVFYHNNLDNNTQQVYDYSWDKPYIDPSTNTWDKGYPTGGNYWSNYTDEDHFRGPRQNLAGRDGVWDHPNTIDENNRDRYPLEKPRVPGSLNVSVYTDKHTYHTGETMHLGLNVSSPDSVRFLCLVLWCELPNHSNYLYMHKHSAVLPIGLDYANHTFRSITLPSLPSGTYVWNVAFLNRAPHEIVIRDTGQWEFPGINP